MYSNDDVAYARGRLQDTIVRYKGRAVRVAEVFDGGDSLHLTSIDCVSGIDVHTDDIEEYDLTPAPLGFVNRRGVVSYLTRRPMREDWRQGFRQHSAYITWNEGAMPWDWSAIGKTINGEFPEIGSLPLIPGQYLAWHRDFCYDAGNNIYYKWYGVVGNFTDLASKSYLLNAEYGWVEESLRESLA